MIDIDWHWHFLADHSRSSSLDMTTFCHDIIHHILNETVWHWPGLLAAVAWPAALIGVAGVIDNPWSVSTQRSWLAGRQLAEVLLSRQQVCVSSINYMFSLLDQPWRVLHSGWGMTLKWAWPRSRVLLLKQWDRYPRSTERISCNNNNNNYAKELLAQTVFFCTDATDCKYVLLSREND